jgi:hypothetical protein
MPHTKSHVSLLILKFSKDKIKPQREEKMIIKLLPPFRTFLSWLRLLIVVEMQVQN